MKKIAIISILLLFLATTTGQVYAETMLGTNKASSAAARDAIKTQTKITRMENLSASKSAMKTQIIFNNLENLRERANTEIERRINFLTELLGKLDNLNKLSDVDKASLKSQIQAQIDSLNALKVKINADLDLTSLRTDVKLILNGHSTFAYFRVKISLYIAVGRLSTTADMLNIVYTKLQTRINEEEAKGTDVTLLKALLLDMFTKISNARAQHDVVITLLNALDVQDFPKNKSSFTEARSKIKLAAEDLRAAYKDAVAIRQGLGDISGNLRKGTFDTKNSSGSASQ